MFCQETTVIESEQLQQWANCPANGHLGSDYGGLDALRAVAKGHAVAQQALDKLKEDVPPLSHRAQRLDLHQGADGGSCVVVQLDDGTIAQAQVRLT